MITDTPTDTFTNQNVDYFLQKFSNLPTDTKDEFRRRHPRFPLREPADVMIDSADSPAEVLMASGRDISRGGIGLYAHRPIPPGTEIIVSVGRGKQGLLKRATTVHSTLSIGLFKIGARFDN